MRTKKFALPVTIVAALAAVFVLSNRAFSAPSPAEEVWQERPPAVYDPVMLADSPPVNQIIIKFTNGRDLSALSVAGREQLFRQLSASAGVELEMVRPMSGDAYVMGLPQWMAVTDAGAISVRLQTLPGVVYAGPNYIMETAPAEVRTSAAAPSILPRPRSADLANRTLTVNPGQAFQVDCTFNNQKTNLGTATPTPTGPTATPTATATSVGLVTPIATPVGPTATPSATPDPGTKGETTTGIKSLSPNPSQAGEPVIVTVFVSRIGVTPAYPTGEVTITDGTVSCKGTLALNDFATNEAGCSLTFIIAGVKTLTATFPGDIYHNGSSGTATHTVTGSINFTDFAYLPIILKQ